MEDQLKTSGRKEGALRLSASTLLRRHSFPGLRICARMSCLLAVWTSLLPVLRSSNSPSLPRGAGANGR
eukprot:7264702-Pyramimonas_sp.AAC.1